MIVDYDGRIVAQATPGDGEKITIGPVDISMLRRERSARQAHQMLLHLRTEAHPVYKGRVYPGGSFDRSKDRTYDQNVEIVEGVRNN